MDDTIMIPPDGDWGWMVVLGVNIINFCTKPLDACFGLLFGDLLKELGIETTGAAFITSSLFAVIYFSGFISGPIMKRFSYRKVTVFGGVLCVIGVILTNPARSVIHIIITYSFIHGFGNALTASSTFVALNHYFVKRRGLAIGLSMTGGAIGTTLFPHAIRILLEEYGFRGTILIIGGVMAHIIFGACFLQPAEWHLKPSVVELNVKSDATPNSEEVDAFPEKEPTHSLLRRKVSPGLGEVEKLSIIQRKTSRDRKFSVVSVLENARKVSVASNRSGVTTIDFPGSLQMYIETAGAPSTNLEHGLSQESNGHQRLLVKEDNKNSLKYNSTQKHELQESKTFLKRIVEFFDFDLLKDPIYLNLIFGIAMFYLGDQNFKLVSIFFYDDIGFTKSQIALLLSIQAFADIVSRLVLPAICERIPCTKRTLFMIGVALLAVARSVMVVHTSYRDIIICVSVAGFVRGICVTNSSVTISEYSTLEKLPAAFGLHMVARGIFTITLGPLLGYIRDITTSYTLCIHLQSCALMLCSTAWSVEYIICWMISRKNNSIR